MKASNPRALLCGCLLGLASLTGRAEPALPPWQVLEFEQQAFFVTAHSRVELTPDSPERWRLRADSSVASNSEQVELEFAPGDGRALHRTRLSKGKDERYKSYDFKAESVLRERRDPPRGTSLPPGEWPVTGSRDIPYPEQAAGLPVTDAYALLALAGRFRSSAEAEAEVVVNTEFNFYRVRMSHVDGPAVEVDYRVSGSAKAVTGSRKTQAVKLEVSPLGDNPDKPDFSLLGLHGEIIVLFDASNGLPVQLRGTAPRLGSAEINLKSATLREPAA